MDTFDLRNALECTFAFCTELNQYIDEKKPWKLDIANPDEKKLLDEILGTIMTGLAHVAYNLSPFFEEKMRELLRRISVGK